MALDPSQISTERIRCVAVWPGWLRGSHWLVAAGVVFEFISAWALRHAGPERAFWLDWHLIVGQAVLLVLLLRLALLLKPGVGHWRSLLPERAQLAAVAQTLKCYLSLGRLPLPNWYAHNPLWKPIYLIIFLLLLGCLLTGFNLGAAGAILGTDLSVLHVRLANAVGGLALLHVVTAVLHELKGQGGTVSAMINGHRYFHAPQQTARPDDGAAYVSVDAIRSTQSGDPDRPAR